MDFIQTWPLDDLFALAFSLIAALWIGVVILLYQVEKLTRIRENSELDLLELQIELDEAHRVIGAISHHVGLYHTEIDKARTEEQL